MTFLKNKKIIIFFFIFSLLQIYYLYSKRSYFHFEILKNPFEKNSYPHLALEKEVIEASSLIKKLNIKKFNFSKKLGRKDDYFYQRMIEYNYPIRFDEKEKYTLFHIEEKTTNCELILSGQFLELRKCN